MSQFAYLVSFELDDARDNNVSFNSLHEGYAVLLEEVDELWDEVKKKPKKRDKAKLLEELVQIGAMAQRMAEDLDLVGD